MYLAFIVPSLAFYNKNILQEHSSREHYFLIHLTNNASLKNDDSIFKDRNSSFKKQFQHAA